MNSGKRADAEAIVSPPEKDRWASRAVASLLTLCMTVLAPGDVFALAASASPVTRPVTREQHHPFEVAWTEAGMDSASAARHALNRLAFGSRPGQVEELSDATDLVAWLEAQLAAPEEPILAAELVERLPALGLSAKELAETYLGPGVVRRLAMRNGDWMLAEGAPGRARDERVRTDGSSPPGEQMEASVMASERMRTMEQFGLDEAERSELDRVMRLYGVRPPRELIAQQLAQKVLRAVHSENQLQEVLVDFWFNHFNVSARDNEARRFVLSYERDAIRPNVFGSFRDLLEATARHPAMLVYLDNATSRAEPGARTTWAPRERQTLARRQIRRGGVNPEDPLPSRPTGLNENYARELLELHTLGVDGGYTQKDVEEVARAFTGWMVVPPEREQPDRRRRRRSGAEQVGFVRDGLFVFHPAFHDAEPKSVLGVGMPAGQGIEDGERVIEVLAGHPSTARFLAHKLAVRFVSDEPPREVVEALEATFRRTHGDLRAVVRTLLEQPDFWRASGQKVRTPFEFVVASLRALDGTLRHPSRELFESLAEMGQRPYAWDAPTGWPDRSDQWLSSGGLLARMNFATALASGGIRGITVRLPEELRAALESTGVSTKPSEGLSSPDFVQLSSALLPGLTEVEHRTLADQLRDLSVREGLEGRGAESQLVGWLLGSPAFQTR